MSTQDPNKKFTKEDVADRVRDIVTEKCEFPRAEVLPASDLNKDLKFDSLDAVELSMEIEKEWNIAIPDEEMETISNVQSIIDIVWNKIPEEQKK